MKKILVLGLLLVSALGLSQSSLNDYNMAVIPSKFSFQKEDNQYRINSTIKAFLLQKGFEVYLTNDEMPEGFMDYNCNKLYVEVLEENTIFMTKIRIAFKDCRNTTLFTTDLAESKDKILAKAYNETLLKTLKSFDKAQYKYSGKTYFDEEAQEKLKSRDVVNVTKETVITEKNEAFIKVINQANQKELILFKTSQPNVFLSTYTGRSGVVVSKENVWFFEYIDGDNITSEKLQIKL